jgi:hypothetical protein
MDKIRIIGMLDQHTRHMALPERRELSLLVLIRLPGHGPKEKRPHRGVRWHAGRIDIKLHAPTGIAPSEREEAVDGRIEPQEATARKAAVRPDAAKAGFRRGTS